jgi:hypothetical protein
LLATLQAIPALTGATFVRVPVVRASSAAPATAVPPQILPVAGASLPMLPLWLVGAGAALAVAGYLILRKA